MTTELPNTTEATRRDGSPLTEGLGHAAPERALTADVFEALDLSPEQFLTDGGLVNRGKLRAALWYPHDYLPEGHWMRAADEGRLRAENARLAREAHTWWTACRDATGEIERLREVAARMVAGIDHLDKLTREWEPDHSSGADRRGWLLAKEARDDAARLLGPNT